MRIAILSAKPVDFVGGVEEFSRDLKTMLERRGHDCVSIDLESVVSKHADPLFFPIAEKTPYRGLHHAKLISKELEKLGPFDVVIANDNLGASAKAKKIVAVSHGYYRELFDSMKKHISPFYYRWGLEMARVQRISYAKADCIVTPSVHNQIHLEKDIRRSVRVIHHFIDCEFHQKKRNALSKLPAYHLPKRFLFNISTNQAPWKNYPMVEALSNRHSVVSIVQKKNPPANLITIQKVPERYMPFFFSAAQAMIHPAYHEGFGYAVAKSMACETPALVGATGIGYELLQKIPEVVVSDVDNRPEWDSKIDYCFDNKKSLGKNCRRWILEECGFKEWKRSWLDVVES